MSKWLTQLMLSLASGVQTHTHHSCMQCQHMCEMVLAYSTKLQHNIHNYLMLSAQDKSDTTA